MITIPLSRLKLGFATLLGTGFVVLGFYLFKYPECLQSTLFKSVEFIKLIGFLVLSSFSIMGFLLLLKIFNSNSGLVIDKNGIYDNSSILSQGLIRWEDINKIEVKPIQSHKIICIYVSNPEDYIKKNKSAIIRILLKLALKRFKYLTSISSVILKIDFEELEKLVRENFEKYKQENSSLS